MNPELLERITSIYLILGSTDLISRVRPYTLRGVNKHLKVYANKSGIKGKRVSPHTFNKPHEYEVWKINNYSEALLIRLSLLFRHSSTSIKKLYLSVTKEEFENLYDIQDLFVY